MSLLPEEEYVESGYFAVTDYVGGIAEGVGIFGGYFVPDADYVDSSYLLDQTPTFTISADLTESIIDTSATLNSSFGLSATALRIKTSTVLLEYFADLSAQGDRSRDNSSTLSGAFNVGHIDGGSFSNNVLPAAIFTGAADLTNSANLTVDGLNVQLNSATLSCSTSLTANAIEYQLRQNDFGRPIDFTVVNSSLSSRFQGGITGQFYTGQAVASSVDQGTGYIQSDDLDQTFNDDFMVIFTGVIAGANAREETTQSDILIYGTGTTPAFRILKSNVSYGGTYYAELQARLYNSSGTQIGLIDLGDASSPSGWSEKNRWDDNTGPYTIYFGRRYDSANNNYVYYLKQARDGLESTVVTKTLSASSYTLADPGTGNRRFRFEAIESDYGVPSPVDKTLTFYHFAAYDVFDINYFIDYGFDNTTSNWRISPNNSDSITWHDWDDGDQTSAFTADDVVGITFTATETFNTTASLTSSLTGIVDSSATLNAFNSTLTAATKVGRTVVSLDNNTTITTDAVKTVSGSMFLTTGKNQPNTELSVDGDRIASGEFDGSVIANISSTPRADFAGAATLLSENTFSVDATGFVGVSIGLNSTASIAVTSTRIKPLASSISAASSLTASADRTRSGVSTQNTTVTVASEALRIKQLSANLSGLAATVSTVVKTGRTVASLDNTVSLTATANSQFIFETDLSAVTNISIIAQKTVQPSVDLNSAAVFEGTPVKTVGITSALSLDSAVTTDISAVKQTESTSIQGSTATVEIYPTYIRPDGGDFAATFGLTVTSTKTTDTTTELSVNAGIDANGGRAVLGAAVFEGVFTSRLLARLILPNIAVYRVPPETRLHTISSENRSHTITREDRTHKVLEGA